MSWLSDGSANRIIQCYAKNFVDVSGNFKVRTAITSSGGGSSSVDTTGASWTQLGSDIDGIAANDYVGWSVSLSSDGTIVAVGATRHDSYRGYVQVHKWDGSSWSQLGSDIDGESTGNYSGWSVSLSSDGTIVAIGAIGNNSYRGHVRVYQYVNSTWTQLGSDIDGEVASDRSGHSVSLSSDGSIVAIGAKSNDGSGSNAGHVRVYQYADSTWTQIGSDIDGEAANDEFGWSVALNKSDGTIVAIGAQGHDSYRGHVRVYQWDGSSWTQLGSDIDGEAASDIAGHSVSLSSDGSILAVGAWGNDAGGNLAGHVRVYEYSGGSWTQLGSDIDGEVASDRSGWSVSLSSDGSIVAIGARYNDGSGSSAGHVRVYQYADSTWTQIGSDIDGEGAGDQSGYSVSLSSYGNIIATGGPYNDGTNSNAGHVRVYDGGFGPPDPEPLILLDVNEGTVSMVNNTMDVSNTLVDISGTAWINRGQSSGTIADAYQGGLVIESSSTTTNDAVLYVETAGQAETFSIRADGAMYSANTLRYSSDDRRKINEQYITNATETIQKLTPQIYTKLNDLEQNGGTPMNTESGLIAQEIYYNAPELQHLVHTDGEPQPYDLSGNDIQSDPDYNALGWGPKSATIDYIGLIPYLIKSNQEQQDNIDNKEQQLLDNKTTLENDIQARIAALEA